MNFRPTYSDYSSRGINITSLVDILFIILIFVLVTTTFLERPGFDIRLPRAKSGVPKQIDEYIISITKDGRIFFDGKECSLSSLPGLIKGQRKPILIEADREAEYGCVVEVIDILRRKGILRFTILTKEE